jgi:homoserine kinase type II
MVRMTGTAGPGFLAGLPPLWGLPAGISVTRLERGTNNQTFLLRQDSRRFVLRVSQNLSAARVRAEHRLLARLHQAGLPFQVPEPLAVPGGGTVTETAAGPATVCRWIPGVRPDLSGAAAVERLGRAAGLLGAAMLGVPPVESAELGNWLGDPLAAHPAVPDVGGLCRRLRAAGIGEQLTAPLAAAARRARLHPAARDGTLPAQVIHGDLAASNALVHEDSGEVSGLLDFEFAGVGYAAQDVMAALYNCGTLGTPDWRHRTAAFLRGYASVRPLDAAEAAALPGLLRERALGTALWRAGRWLDGKSQLADVAGRLRKMADTSRWLDANAGELRSLAAAGGRQ